MPLGASSRERARAGAWLEQSAEALGDVQHTTVLADGQAVPVLLRLADEQGAQLLVTGSARHGRLDRVLIGSVSAELAAKAACPVVVVPDDAALDLTGPIVAGYDGSDESLRAAGHAAGLAAGLARQLVVVHVAEDDAEPIPAEGALARALAAAAATARDAGAQRLDASIAQVRGDPAERLAEVGRARGAALLVMGTRGRGAVTAALLGSVSSAVTGHEKQAVLLVGPAVASAATD